jgi:hypothetical protein
MNVPDWARWQAFVNAEKGETPVMVTGHAGVESDPDVAGAVFPERARSVFR